MFAPDQEFARHVGFALSFSGTGAPRKGVVILERVITLALALMLTSKVAAGIVGFF